MKTLTKIAAVAMTVVAFSAHAGGGYYAKKTEMAGVVLLFFNCLLLP